MPAAPRDIDSKSLTMDERAILAQLEDPPEGLAVLRAVLLNEHRWRQRKGSTREPDIGGRPPRSIRVALT